MDELKSLVEMDTLEMERVHLQREKGSLPQEQLALEQRLQLAREALGAVESGLQVIEGTLQHKQDDLAQEKIALERSNARLSAISTNREYDAVHAEILIHTEKSGRLLADIQRLELEKQAFQQSKPKVQEQLQQVEKECLPRLAAIAETLSGIDIRMAQVAANLEPVRAQVPRDMRVLYQKLLSSRQALLMSGKQKTLVAQLGDVDVGCTVCFFGLTKQSLLVLRKGGKILQCPNCGAFLVHNA